MSVIVAFSAVVFSVYYFREAEKSSIKEGALIGVLWMVISLIIDLALFLSPSPMQMTLTDYISDVGVVYLIIPVITIGFSVVRKQ